MFTVAGTYLHITDHIYEKPDFTERRQTFENSLIEITKGLYGENFEIILRVDEGGTFLNVLLGVATLTTIFSQGQSAFEAAYKLSQKAFEYGSMVIEEVQQKFDVPDSEIQWKQRRQGDIRELVSIAENVKKVREESLSREELRQIEKTIQKDLYQLGQKVSDIQEIAPILRELPIDELPGLPTKPEDVRIPIVGLPPRRKFVFSDSFDEDYSSIPQARRYHKKAPRRHIYETTLTTSPSPSQVALGKDNPNVKNQVHVRIGYDD